MRGPDVVLADVLARRSGRSRYGVLERNAPYTMPAMNAASNGSGFYYQKTRSGNSQSGNSHLPGDKVCHEPILGPCLANAACAGAGSTCIAKSIRKGSSMQLNHALEGSRFVLRRMER